MKKIIILIAIAAAAMASVSCEKDVRNAPESVQAVFDRMYPGAFMVEWEVYRGRYTADFQFDGHEMEANFEKNGQWLWSKTEILMSEVPEAVILAARAFDGGKWVIDDIDHYTRSSGEPEYYRVEYDRTGSERERVAYFRPDGVQVKNVS